MFEGPQNVQSQIKGRSVAACYMTSEFGNGAGIYGARDVSDSSDIDTDGICDMKQGGQSTKVCGPVVLMTAKLFRARFYQVCLSVFLA